MRDDEPADPAAKFFGRCGSAVARPAVAEVSGGQRHGALSASLSPLHGTTSDDLASGPALPDNGLAGAQIAIGDNNTTGRFLGQSYELLDVPVGQQVEPAALLHELVGTDIRLLLTDLDADRLLALADAGRAEGVTLFNIAAQDDRLRQQECRAK